MNLIFDWKRYQNDVLKFAAVTGREVGEVVRDEARLLTGEVIEATPPFSGKMLNRMGKPGFTGTARRIGENAVKRDVGRVFRPVSGLDIFKRDAGFQKLTAEGKVEKIQQILGKSARFGGVLKTADGQSRLHQQQRTKRGVVRKNPVWYAVLDASSVTKYTRRVQKLVGMARAGWSVAANAFGVKLPGWISRHNSPGYAVNRTSATDGVAEAAAGNLVPWIQWAEGKLGVVRYAVSKRRHALAAKIRKAVEDAFDGKKSTTN